MNKYEYSAKASFYSIIGIVLCITLATLLSCSRTDDSECECVKESYEIQTTIVFDTNGTPTSQIEHVLLFDEVVQCQEEVRTYTGDFTYFKIVCNE